jgi:two-component system phosphate regulon response regulator PhoB
MSEHILIIDDEPDIVELLDYNLRQAGYTVVNARDGASAIATVRRHRPDLIVLDLMLPDIPGIEVCRRLRRESASESIPILMLTARTEEIDRVVGFEVGADDYVTKPFSPREIVLRVQALLRRSKPKGEMVPLLRIGLLEIDVPRHRVIVEGEDIPLTALEFKLLFDLASRRGRVQSRDDLLERVWGYVPGIETRTVDTHVKRLREKLGAARDYIETIRGVGYRMRE